MNDVEVALRAAGETPMRFGPTAGPDEDLWEGRIEENLHLIHAELDAPRPGWLERVLRHIGVPDLTVPLVSATPALRRSWVAATVFALLFALSVDSNSTAIGPDRVVTFLTLAPLVPLLGVALAFGRGVDPTYELLVAAPRDTFRVFLIRCTTVLVASASLLLVASTLLPEVGWYRVAWLLPALALTSITMGLAARRDPRRVAAAVAGAWILVVVVIVQAASASEMFGPAAQVVFAGCAAIGAMVVWRRRGAVEDIR
ncbi:MAG: zf-HC2 domain-containing protein [Actinomycetota bacterium]